MPAPVLARPVLMLVTERAAAGDRDELVRRVAEAVEGGVNVVQLREKDLDHESLVLLGRLLHDAIDGRSVLVVNSAADAAVEAGAEGVHLPEAAAFVRPPGLLVGRSVHSVEGARRAEAEGADYVVAGPVFPTATHPGSPGAGVRLIEEVSRAVSLPVIAIGGITPERVPEVMGAGAAGVAVISSVLRADDAWRAAVALREALATGTTA